MTKKGSTGRNRDATCSFCRKSYRDVGPLVEGPGGVYICGECVELCQHIIEQEKRRRAPPGSEAPAIPSPDELVEKLSPYFAGQEEAVRAVCDAVHDRYDRLAWAQQQQKPPDTEAVGILLLGPSRVSKLFLARFLAHLFGVPFAHGDAQTALEPDAVGPESGSVLYQLLMASGFDIEAAQRGIVYLDGVDDPDAQNRLLEVFQGRADDLLPRELRMDITSLLLVGGGLFAGLDEVSREPESAPSAADLVAYGMTPELAQRFRAIVTLGALDEDALARFASVVDLKHFSD